MCCCIPENCLKYLIYFACFILLGVGGVLIWSGYVIQNLVLSNIISFSYTGYIVIACGGVLILASFSGCLGAWKKQKFFLTLFIIVAFIIGLILIAFGSVLIYIKTLAQGYFGSTSDCINKFSNADTAASQATYALCSLYCPCNAGNSYVTSYCSDKNSTYCTFGGKSILECNPCEKIQTYSSIEVSNLTYFAKNYLNIDITRNDCTITSQQYKNQYFSSSTRDYIPVLTWVENTFSCSGLCTPQKLYLFSDINKGKPTNGCLTEVYDWINTNFLTYAIISIVFGAFMVIYK
jgi:Tetraspanin family